MTDRRSSPSPTMEYLHQSWPADPEYTQEARAEVRRWVSSLPLSADEADGVVLAASEAIDNAVRHAYPAGQRGGVELTLWTEEGVLHVDIADHGRWRDTEDGQVGRGIVLMRSLVESVVINFGPTGTCVSLSQLLPTQSRGSTT